MEKQYVTECENKLKKPECKKYVAIAVVPEVKEEEIVEEPEVPDAPAPEPEVDDGGDWD
jgi:hypothetical protein